MNDQAHNYYTYYNRWLKSQDKSFPWLLRNILVDEYSYAIPNPEAIETIIKHSPLVEIGCGLGYWAHLIRMCGGDIVAYDNAINEKGQVKLHSKNQYVTPYTTVIEGNEDSVKNNSDRTLFLCWPPMSNMGYECLHQYLQHGGQKLIYIGEGPGGCTGDDDFHQLLRNQMECIEIHSIPRWVCINDRMYIYQVKNRYQEQHDAP